MKFIFLLITVSPLSAFAMCMSPMLTGNARMDQQAQATYMSCIDNERRIKAQQEQMEQQKQAQERQQRIIQQQMQEQQNQMDSMQRRMNGGR